MSDPLVPDHVARDYGVRKFSADETVRDIAQLQEATATLSIEVREIRLRTEGKT